MPHFQLPADPLLDGTIGAAGRTCDPVNLSRGAAPKVNTGGAHPHDEANGTYRGRFPQKHLRATSRRRATARLPGGDAAARGGRAPSVRRGFGGSGGVGASLARQKVRAAEDPAAASSATRDLAGGPNVSVREPAAAGVGRGARVRGAAATGGRIRARWRAKHGSHAQMECWRPCSDADFFHH